MAGRIRTIKPEILEDDRTSTLSHAGFRLFIGAIVLADDQGNLRGNVTYLAGAVFHSCEPESAGAALAELEASGLVTPYTVNGSRYLHVAGWQKHQRIDRPGKPRCPGPEKAGTDSRAPRESVANDSRTPREGFASASRLTSDLRPPTSDPDRDQDPDRDHHTERVDPPPADADAGPGHTQGALVLSPPPAPGAQAMMARTPKQGRDIVRDAKRYAEVSAVVVAWNAAARGTGLTLAVERPMKRRDGHIAARLAEVGLEQLEHVFGWLAKSPHHTGGSSSGWAADLSWVVSSSEHLATLVQRADRAASGVVPAMPAAPVSHAQRLMARALDGATPTEREEMRRWQAAR